jgi:hypothetical protein
MFKSLASQSIGAVGVAVIVGLTSFLTPIYPAKSTVSPPEYAEQRALAKGDKLPRLVTGSACSSKSWPNYDRACQYDLRTPADATATVRIVSLNRFD